MRKFIVNLFSNRFGIVLATLNLCVFAAAGRDLFNYPLGKIFACINLPSMISTWLSVEFIRIFAGQFSFAARNVLIGTLLGVFIALQWLLIARFASRLADRIQRSDLWKNQAIWR
jgi:hypothetical protein